MKMSLLYLGELLWTSAEEAEIADVLDSLQLSCHPSARQIMDRLAPVPPRKLLALTKCIVMDAFKGSPDSQLVKEIIAGRFGPPKVIGWEALCLAKLDDLKPKMEGKTTCFSFLRHWSILEKWTLMLHENNCLSRPLSPVLKQWIFLPALVKLLTCTTTARCHSECASAKTGVKYMVNLLATWIVEGSIVCNSKEKIKMLELGERTESIFECPTADNYQQIFRALPKGVQVEVLQLWIQGKKWSSNKVKELFQSWASDLCMAQEEQNLNEFTMADRLECPDRMEEDGPASSFTGRLLWKLEDLSTLTNTKYTSEHFMAGGYKWCFCVYPRGDKTEHLSVYLNAEEAKKPGWSINTKFTITLVSQTAPALSVEREHSHIFNAKEADWGLNKFISLEKLHSPCRGYVVNDTLLLQVEVQVKL
eukprot:TRINITY_DN17200_c0_g1_i2.p1 TRINITY_DN17200_c0_g1~~TRINITY_DN17200_c0_g1_i2.p1  ORF type:complete len:467 (-),score=46.51 TRINITY_DN17200_c0_g1_i2:526-1785(-)